MNIFSKVGRNVYLTPITKAKIVGGVLGFIIACIFFLFHAFCCFKYCLASKNKIKYDTFCKNYDEIDLPQNCIINRYYMNK